MDPNRFDRLSRAVAGRLSRRGLLVAIGTGSALALDDSAQAATKTTCVYTFDATIDVGPSSKIAQNDEISGDLTIAISASGEITSGKLVKPDGTSWSVVGETTGRAVTLRIAVPHAGALVAIGAGSHDVATCPSTLSGPAAGPLAHDAGSWIATLKVTAAPSSTTATATSGASGNAAPSSGSQSQPTEPSSGTTSSAPIATSTSAPTMTPTPEPTAAPTTAASNCTNQCGSYAFDPTVCACQCPSGQTSCLETRSDNSHATWCADFTSDVYNCGACGNSCYLPGVSYDIIQADCTNSVCGFYCLGEGRFATCDPSNPCGTDLTKDPANCGACGHVCPTLTSNCVSGKCV